MTKLKLVVIFLIVLVLLQGVQVMTLERRVSSLDKDLLQAEKDINILAESVTNLAKASMNNSESILKLAKR